jgi:CRISPR system Cascade subunit CasB
VKSEDTQSLPWAMSEKNGDNNVVSELRFKSLLKADSIDDVFIDLRRVLPLIGKKADIYQLAKDVYYWNDNTKKQWAYSYRWA